MIKVLIADDHPTMRNGLKVFLENFDDMQLVGEAASGTEAVDLCSQLQPDVVLMDILMPHMDGVIATKLILKHCPDTKVILMSGSFQGNLKKATLDAGAHYYMYKDRNIDEMAEAIRSVFS